MDKRTINAVLAVLASRGGKASARSLTKAQRVERARCASKARWSKAKKGGAR